MRPDRFIAPQLTCGPDGEPLAVPVIPSDATADEIEAIEAAEGVASMPDELSAHLAQGVTCDGFAR